ncbi:MAG: SprT family zinc-dependent metalloprotease [Microgenomates group bacterium]
MRSQRRSIAIQIEPTGKIFVKAPYLLPKFLVDQFVQKKMPWIKKKIAVATKFPLQIKKTIADGDIYYYLGTPHAIRIGNFQKITCTETMNFPKHLLFRGKIELTNWYIQEAKRIIDARVIYFSHLMKTTYTRVSFSDTSSKWGSCFPDNSLQFNWRLVMAPIIVLDYVVVHELAHTKEKNHRSNFWKIVANQKPAYKQHIKWLKENANKLHLV